MLQAVAGGCRSSGMASHGLTRLLSDVDGIDDRVDLGASFSHVSSCEVGLDTSGTRNISQKLVEAVYDIPMGLE